MRWLIDTIDDTPTAHPARPQAFGIREGFCERTPGIFGQLFETVDNSFLGRFTETFQIPCRLPREDDVIHRVGGANP